MERVGWRVQVFWEGEAAWFDGVITQYSPDEGFFVKYDDGEEQWEDASGDTPIRFLSKPEGDDDAPASLSTAADAQEGGKWSQQPPPSSAYTDADYADDDYDNDGDDQEEEESVALRKSPTPKEEASSPVAKFQSKSTPTSPTNTSNNQPLRQQQQQPRKANLYVNNALFFRDEETVRVMRKALQTEKKTLVHEHQTLARQLIEKEQLSANLKRELSDLKTRVTLASVLSHAPSTAGGQSSAPKMPSDWSERVLDQRLQNKQTKQEIAELKACVQQKQHAIQQHQRQCDQLKDSLARAPRRDLCSLVDLQVEIAQLLEVKRALEATQKPKASSTMRFKGQDPAAKANSEAGTFGWQSDANTHKVTLEKELSKLELASSRAKDEIHRWKLNFERENARILPLKARLLALQQELSKFETSSVLLRSAFLRLSPDAEGKISLQTAAEALLALAPADVTSFTSSEAILAALRKQGVLSSGAQEQLVFSDFVACFNCLFKS